MAYSKSHAKRLSAVLRLAADGCNISRDIAFALRMSFADADAYVEQLIAAGALRYNGRTISTDNPGRREPPSFKVFDLVQQEAAE